LVVSGKVHEQLFGNDVVVTTIFQPRFSYANQGMNCSNLYDMLAVLEPKNETQFEMCDAMKGFHTFFFPKSKVLTRVPSSKSVGAATCKESAAIGSGEQALYVSLPASCPSNDAPIVPRSAGAGNARGSRGGKKTNAASRQPEDQGGLADASHMAWSRAGLKKGQMTSRRSYEGKLRER
jgi:hypothetical protein